MPEAHTAFFVGWLQLLVRQAGNNIMTADKLFPSPGQARLRSLALLLALLVSACSSDGSDTIYVGNPPVPPALTGCSDTDSCASNPTLQIGGDRIAQVQIPSDYTATTRYPLIVLLHGFGANGFVQSLYLGLDTRVDSGQYILVVPDGTENLAGERYWNATPACCAFSEAEKQVDDVAYIRGLIEEAAATYSIDPSRVGLIGHSNGGFMALRMACEASDVVTSVVSLAGSTFAEDASCTPASQPVSVLTLHGDEDRTILYEGGQILRNAYPGAQETSRRFAAHAQCDTANPATAPNLDVVESVDGAETEVLEYSGCVPGVDVTLWTMVGAPHIPIPWVASSLDLIVEWVTEHSRL
jgi:polyhydroxybutyrate depolymerase